MAANLGLRVFNITAPEQLTRGQFLLLAMKSQLDHIKGTKGPDDIVVLPW